MKWILAMLLASTTLVAQAQESDPVGYCKATAYLALDIGRQIAQGLDPTSINFSFPNAQTLEEQQKAEEWGRSLVVRVVNEWAENPNPEVIADGLLQECLTAYGALQESHLQDENFIKTQSGYDKHSRRAVCYEQIKRFDGLHKLYRQVGYNGVLNTFPPEKEGFPREYAIEILNEIELINTKEKRDAWIEEKWWTCIEKFGGSRETDS
jgi:hypothetical protein